MKNTSLRILLVYLMACSNALISKSQNMSVTDYFNRAGEYSVLFSGETEQTYNAIFYDNHPYYAGDEFVTGSLVYKRNHYPNVRMRLDLHKDQLIVLTPEKQYSKIAPPEEVDSIYVHNKVFFNHTPPTESGLKQGYYMLLTHSKNSRLLGRTVFSIDYQKPEEKKKFSQKSSYYFVYKDTYHTVSNRKSFYKIFPEHKKLIKKFAKENALRFKTDRENCLTVLAKYCEELTN